jgi:hypothetical protein
MTTQKFHHDYPYRLKIQHFEGAELRLERKGRWIRVDPVDPVAEGDAVVLTAASAARAGAVVRALRAGTAFTLVASVEVLAWARALATGALDGHADSADIDGVHVAVQPYAAATPAPALHVGAFVRAAAAGLRGRDETFPDLAPSVLQFTFPDGARLVHMDLALHGSTDSRWLDEAVTHFGGAEWTIVGQPWGEAEAVARLAPRLGSRRLLVTELLNGERRALGLPTELVTPLRDRLVAAGVEAHVFATQTSYRFE